MPVEITKITSELSERVQEILGEKLRKIILFGSYARGDHDEDSDIDIMVLADVTNNDEIIYLRDEISDIASDISLENNITVSAFIKDFKFFFDYSEAVPYYRNVINDGINIYG